jgi:type 1 glutamine amidotransferase
MTGSIRVRRSTVTAIGALTLLVSFAGLDAQQTAPPAGAAPQAGGRGGGRGGVGPVLFTAMDADKDGAVTRAEMQTALAGPVARGNTSKAAGLAQSDLATALSAALPAPSRRTPNDADVQEMLKVLPSTAPAKPARPRRVLVLTHSPGFTHSSIPLAARAFEELGRRTGAWTADVRDDPNVVTTANLKPYDAIVLDSTVGAFLDEAGDPAATEARRAALLAFVRSGKGLVGLHGAADTYHSGAANTPFTRPSTQIAAALVAQGDRDADQRLSAAELRGVIDAWFDQLDTAKAGRVTSAEFAERFSAIVPAGGGRAGGGREGRGGGGRGADAPAPAPFGGAQGAPSQSRGARGSAPSGATWPEFNRMIGGIFKSHPWQQVPITIEDPGSPLTSMFKTKSFEFQDETYTFYGDSWSRANVRVLMSIDYAKMSDEDKAREANASARTDGDYGLSWIRRDGNGRVFYLALGHREDGIYRSPEMMRHLLAGTQYAIGDLKADDAPRAK